MDKLKYLKCTPFIIACTNYKGFCNLFYILYILLAVQLRHSSWVLLMAYGTPFLQSKLYHFKNSANLPRSDWLNITQLEFYIIERKLEER